jgi:hypothetical protein
MTFKTRRRTKHKIIAELAFDVLFVIFASHEGISIICTSIVMAWVKRLSSRGNDFEKSMIEKHYRMEMFEFEKNL